MKFLGFILLVAVASSIPFASIAQVKNSDEEVLIKLDVCSVHLQADSAEHMVITEPLYHFTPLQSSTLTYRQINSIIFSSYSYPIEQPPRA